ncbi:MAG: glycosyltransferase family 2 protein [Chloroflexi bacterium]|nr:glycosyltransferase family 2 protein [Chloroflexota bacterium]
MPGISVVLPAYNEEECLPRTVAAVIGALEEVAAEYEVVVVDDGSKDRTGEVARDLAEKFPLVRVIRHPVNRGYGGALATGFAAAAKDLIFFTDADNQFDVREIGKLLPYIGDYDLVIGYRAPRVDPFVRKLNALGWKTLVNLLFGYTARDVDCAFKLFKRDVLDNIKIESRGATFSAEFLVRARRKGYRIMEVPVKHLPRLAGSPTGARPSVVLRAFRELISFRQRLIEEEKAAQK